MKKIYKRVPFDIELAKKIQSGEVEGRIVTNEGNSARIICFDAYKRYADNELIALIKGEGCDEAVGRYKRNGELVGKSCNDDDLFIELPEETPNPLEQVFNEMKDSEWNGYFKSNKNDCGQCLEDASVKETPKHIGEWFIDLVSSMSEKEQDEFREHVKNNLPYLRGKGEYVPYKHEFKPFDKVLVRNHDGEIWCCALFSHKDFSLVTPTIITTDNMAWKQCIPYNEQTKHLVGTTNDSE